MLEIVVALALVLVCLAAMAAAGWGVHRLGHRPE